MAFGAQGYFLTLIFSSWATIQSNKYSLKKVLDCLKGLSYKKHNDIQIKNLRFKKYIKFNNIYYKYNNSKYILKV